MGGLIQLNKELTEKLNKKYNVFFDWIIEKQNKTTKPLLFGFSCNDGWYWLLDNLMNSIYHYQKLNQHLKGNEKFIQITQVKEKFGGLCFYYSGGNEAIRGMVSLAENLSYKICEKCGTTENVGRTKGWIYVCCEKCYKNNERSRDLDWIPNENIRLEKLNKIKKLINKDN